MEIGIFIMGFAFGWMCYRLILFTVTEDFVQQMSNEIKDSESEIICVLEKHQNQYFLYQHPDMTFLSQSDSLEKITEFLNHKFQKSTSIKVIERTNETSSGQ